jgi:hypothetical protein
MLNVGDYKNPNFKIEKAIKGYKYIFSLLILNKCFKDFMFIPMKSM